jgi:hypothetical protein
MAEVDLPLLVHGEVTDPAIDVFDRESAFIEEVLGPLIARFPNLKVVLEHITTREATQFVEVTGPNIAATITAHHLLMNRNSLFLGGVRPHHYCLPVLKREEHREALVEAATSAIRSSSSAPTALRTRAAPRKPRAAALACIPRMARSSSTRWRSRKPASSTSSRASRAASGRSSTGCSRTATGSRSCARNGRCRRRCRSGRAKKLIPLRAGE